MPQGIDRTDKYFVSAAVLLSLGVALLVLLLMRAEWRGVLDEVQGPAMTVSSLLADHTDTLQETADLVRAQAVELVTAGGDISVEFSNYQQMNRLVRVSPHVVSVWIGDAAGAMVFTVNGKAKVGQRAAR